MAACASAHAGASRPVFDVTVAASSASVSAGQTEQVAATATANQAASGYNLVFIVTFNGAPVEGERFDDVSFAASQPVTQTYSRTIAAHALPGTYKVTAEVRKNGVVYGSGTASFAVTVNGACGAANGKTFAKAPKTGLCAAGTASKVTGAGPFDWSCAGSTNGGAGASCSAALPTAGSTTGTTPPKSCTDSSGAAHASGSVYTLQLSQTAGSIAATASQCPYGGTQPTTTTVTQSYSCTNGVSTAQGNSVTATVDSGSPACNAPAACGSTPSGSTVTQTVSTTAGSIAATTAQCPYGGTQPTTTTVTQVQLCTNGTLSNQGAPVSATVNSGSPSCNAEPANPPPALVNGSCGSANAQVSPSVPAGSNLCATGTASAVAGGVIGAWTWSCSGADGGTTASCGADPATLSIPVKSLPLSGGLYNVPDMYGCCSQVVTITGDGTSAVNMWMPSYWPNLIQRINANTISITDQHANGQQTILINVPTVYFQGSGNTPLETSTVTAVYGTCGSANGAQFASAPTSNLCTLGTVSAVSGTGPWTWTCTGSNGGGNASCSASPNTPINGACGASGGATLPTIPTSGLCSAGTAGSVAGTGPWTWTCSGLWGGQNTSCQANLTAPENGACGYANNAKLSHAPLSGLCSVGVPSAVQGSGPWTWTCAPQYNGTLTASCSASVGPAVTGNNVLAVGSYTSSAALSDQANYCTGNTPFPTQWVWDPAKIMNQPRAATDADNLQPKVEQYRNGQLIATWHGLASNPNTCQYQNNLSATNPSYSVAVITQAAATGCGPFGNISHVDIFRLWEDGDEFWVYPAVYKSSEYNYIMLQPNYSYDWGNPADNHAPHNIVIKGITQTINGEQVRPAIVRDDGGPGDWASSQGEVYIETSYDTLLENLDIIGAPSGSVAMAGVYINGANNLTFQNVSVHDFASQKPDAASGYVGANGIFGTPNNSGTLTFDGVIDYNNGGFRSSYMHNFYLAGSQPDPSGMPADILALDPNTFTVKLLNSYTADSVIGHTFKSRAQNNILIGNYFKGGLPNTAEGYTQADNYLADIPNGGVLVAKDNVFAKNASGDNSNGISLTYAMEGIVDSRALSVDIENNTFVAFAKYYDDEYHQLFPIDFFYPAILPTDPSFPPMPYSIKNNAFVGYCPYGTPPGDYRGDLAVTEGFSELNLDFSFSNKVLSDDTSITGTLDYEHEAQPGVARQVSTIGAKD